MAGVEEHVKLLTARKRPSWLGEVVWRKLFLECLINGSEHCRALLTRK